MERTYGIISDTHGLIRPEALAALAGVERIFHAGDVGSLRVNQDQECIALANEVVRDVGRGLQEASSFQTRALAAT
jgi:predicted phosphodiesterase